MPNITWSTNYTNESMETDLACRFVYNDGTSSSANVTRGFGSIVVENSLNVDKTCFSGSDLEVGSIIADELNLQIFLNEDGEIEWTYSGTTITVADLTMLVGGYICLANYIGNTTTVQYKFYIDEINYEATNILSVHGYTDLIKMDKVVLSSTVNAQLPMTLKDMFQWCFTQCGLTAPTVSTSIPHYSQSVTEDLTLDEGTTYRQLASWCLSLMNCNLVNWQTENKIVQLAQGTSSNIVQTITDTQTFSRGLNPQLITVTGVRYTFEDDTTYLSGTEGYVLEFSANPIIESNPAFKTFYNSLVGLSYMTCELTTINMPYLVPTDWVKVDDEYCYITHTNVGFNQAMTVESAGESGVIKGLSPNKINANTVSKLVRNAVGEISEDILEEAEQRATELISDSLGGYVVIKDTNGDGHPDEILIMDTQDTATATKVWRWNSGGLGYSGTGYTGTYFIAMNNAGEIVADRITTGSMSANRVTTGILQDANGNVKLDLDNGTLKISNKSIDTSIASIVTKYAKNTSPTTAPSASSFTYDNPPSRSDGEYIWRQDTYTPFVGSARVETVCITGDKGSKGDTGGEGTGVYSTEIRFGKSSSASTAPTTWYETTAEVGATNGDYFWTRTVITYTDTTTSTSYSIAYIGTNGTDGEDGEDGQSSYSYVRYSEYSDGRNMVANPTSATKYVGLYSGTSSTCPAYTAFTWSKYVGDDGVDGNGINNIYYYYKTTTTQTAPAASEITSTTIPAMSETNKYLWQKEVIDFTDTSVADKITVSLISIYGDKGADGDDGTSITISSTAIEYVASNSGTVTPTSGWSTTIPSVSNGQYLWTRTTVNYSDSTSTVSYAVAYKGTNGTDGAKGDKGDDGTSVTISSKAVHYQTSSSGTVVPTGTWYANVPSIPSGHFLWTRTVVEYSDGNSTTAYSVSHQGTDGKGISSTVIRYGKSSSSTTQPTTWYTTESAVNPQKGDYFWTKTTTTYTDSTSTTALSVSYIGNDGEDGNDGDDGVSISRAHSIYYHTASTTAPSAPTTEITSTSASAVDTWIRVCPSLSVSNPYVYTATQYVYSDGTIGCSTVSLDPVASNMSNWCVANDTTLINGAKIDTGTITADKIAANQTLTQTLTATNFNLTGGSINISTSTETDDVIQLNSGTLSAKLSPYSLTCTKNATTPYSSMLTQKGMAQKYNGTTVAWIGQNITSCSTYGYGGELYLTNESGVVKVRLTADEITRHTFIKDYLLYAGYNSWNSFTFDNGIKMCWIKSTRSSTLSQWTYGWYGSGLSWTYPFTFNNIPAVYVSASDYQYGAISLSTQPNSVGTTTTTPTIKAVSNGDPWDSIGTRTLTVCYYILAIGY